MDQNKLSTKSNISKFVILTTLLFTLTSLVTSTQQANAAGGTTASDSTSGLAGLSTTQQTTVSPLTNSGNNSNGFSYSQQFSGYGVNNGCGTQFSIGTNYGNSISPYSTSSSTISTISQANTNSYTIGANIVFNSQQCSDPNKQLELQNKQIQSQRDTSCISERNKFATTVFIANPKITSQELDKMLDVVCK
jgi:hypothetical protein